MPVRHGCRQAARLRAARVAEYARRVSRLRFFRRATAASRSNAVGTTDTDEWEDLLTVYDKYPLEELIIHPRIQKDFYKYTPRMECYRTAYETSRCSLCYNGDIFSPDDFQNLCREFPDTEKVMLGRGVLQNPWLIGMLRSADPAGSEASAPDKELLHAFCEDLCAGYARVISGDKMCCSN